MKNQSQEVWFSQAFLNADELESVCEKLRENPLFRFSPRKIEPYEIHALQINRMVFPLGHMPAIPAFFQSNSVREIDIEWEAFAMDSPEAFRMVEKRFADSPFIERECTVSC